MSSKRSVSFSEEVKRKDGGRVPCPNGNCDGKWASKRCSRCKMWLCDDCVERSTEQSPLMCGYCVAIIASGAV